MNPWGQRASGWRGPPTATRFVSTARSVTFRTQAVQTSSSWCFARQGTGLGLHWSRGGRKGSRWPRTRRWIRRSPRGPLRSTASRWERGTSCPRARGTVFAHLLDLGAMMVTAETVGAAEGAHAITAQFAKEREQFDRVIGAYQGVKHPAGRDVRRHRILQVPRLLRRLGPGRRRRGRFHGGLSGEGLRQRCLPRIGIDCVQLHGGVGYTWEYDIQLYLKRSKWLRPTFGDADYHYERIAALGGL